jgi:hypothetical protein
MYEEHPTFELNKSINKPIWKYMDFWKFLNLLDTSCLYFSESENLGDNFEGRIPKAVLKLMLEEDERLDRNSNKELNGFIENTLRKETLISSWTYHQKESFAMWKMYAKNKMGLAIKTNLDSLKNSFKQSDRSIYIGEVRYFDESKFRYNTSNLYYPFLVKLEYYSFEEEIRCITSCREEEPKEGKLVEVDLNELIRIIYISPNSKPEFKKMLELLRREYNLNFKIEFSEVNDSWL